MIQEKTVSSPCISNSQICKSTIVMSSGEAGLAYCDKSINQVPINHGFDLNNYDDIESFISLVQNTHHTYTHYANGFRSADNFLQGFGVVIDFDNKDFKVNSSMSEFVNSFTAQSYNWILYSSKSHTKQGDCFHVVFPLSCAVNTVDHLEKITKHIKNDLSAEGIIFDNVSPRQIFAPSVQCGYSSDAFHWEIELSNVFVDPSWVTVDGSEATKRYSSPVQEKSLWYQETFEAISKKKRFQLLREYAAHHRETPMTFGEWAELRNMFETELGSKDGFICFRILSLGYDKSCESVQQLRYHWNRLKKSQRVSRKFHNAGWIIHAYKTSFPITMRLKQLLKEFPPLKAVNVPSLLVKRARAVLGDTGRLTTKDMKEIRKSIIKHVTVREYRSTFALTRVIDILINSQVIQSRITIVIREKKKLIRCYFLRKSPVTDLTHDTTIGIPSENRSFKTPFSSHQSHQIYSQYLSIN